MPSISKKRVARASLDETDDWLLEVVNKADEDCGKEAPDPPPKPSANGNGHASTLRKPPPQRDIAKDHRNLAKVVSLLQWDTPERAAILKKVGLGPNALSQRSCLSLHRVLLRLAEEDQPGRYAGKRTEEDLYTAQRSLGLQTRRLSEVLEREVEWLWYQRIPNGKLTLVCGDPDLGKSWSVLDLLARITTGRAMPDGSPNPFLGKERNVLWASAEDDDEDTTKPRFCALGGEPTRLHSLHFVLDRVERKKGEFGLYERTLDLSRHLEHLDRWLTKHPLVVAVGLDPVAAFLGKVDTHRNSEVRAAFTPLKELASKHHVAILCNNHLNKGDDENAMYRSMGSIAFVAAVRSAWLVTKDPKQPKDRRLFTKMKNNLASEDVGGLAFRVGPMHKAQGGFFWETGTVETTADEALRTVGQETRAPARAEAKEWLQDLLKDGPVLASEVWSKAEADGLNDRTLSSAKKALGIRTTKTGGPGTPWVWGLPKKTA
jgi:hypothetical protein